MQPWFKMRMIFSIVFFFSVTLSAQEASSFYKEGLTLKETGKAREALEKFKKALLLKPGYTEALYEMGWCYNDLKEYKNAITSLQQARNGMGTFAKLYFELGYAFEKSELYDSARKTYKRCLELNPVYSGAFRQLGQVAYLTDDNAAALDYFRQYEMTWKVPSTDYFYWFQKGFSFNAMKQYDSASTALNKSLEFKKNYTNTWLELGFACSRLKKNEESISYYKKAIELLPESHIPYNGIGEVYRDNYKNMDEAINWYRKALEINSNERKANYGMGYCLNSKSNYTEALPYLRKAVAAEPTYMAAYVELGYALFKTGSLPEAVTNLRKAIELNPKNENARYYLVLLYVQQKDKVNAQRYVDELRSLSSKYVTELQAKVDTL